MLAFEVLLNGRKICTVLLMVAQEQYSNTHNHECNHRRFGDWDYKPPRVQTCKQGSSYG